DRPCCRNNIFGEATSAFLIAGAIERFEAEVARIPVSCVLAGIGLEARRLDTGDRASLVAVGGVRGIPLAKALGTVARWEALTPQELENLAGARQEKPSADYVHRDLAARPELVGARRVRGEPRTRPCNRI